MANEIKAAVITGIFTLVAGFVGGAFLSPSIFNNNQNITVFIDGSEVKVYPSEYQSIITNLETENNKLKSELESANQKASDKESTKYQEGYNAGLKDGASNIAQTTSDSVPQSSASGHKNLSDMSPVSGKIDSNQYGIWNVTNIDNYENKYSSGIYLRQYSKSAARVVYALDGKYTNLSGKFVLSQSGKNADGHYSIIFYSLKSDKSEELLYESPKLSTATRPIDISIDVTGVMDLVIEVYDSNIPFYYAWTAFVNATLK